MNGETIGNGVEPLDGRRVLPVVTVPGNSLPGPTQIKVACSPSNASKGEFAAFLVTDRHPHVLAFEASIQRPSQIEVGPRSIAESLGLALGFLALALAIAVGYPATQFNATWEENRALIRRKLRVPVRGRGRPLTRGLELLVFATVGGVLTGFLSPGFGLSDSSLWMALGITVGIIILAIASGAADLVFGLLRTASVPLHIIWGSILIAMLCVALSRILHFQPGYIYGLIAGFSLKHDLSRTLKGRLSALSSAVVLAVAMAAWLALVPITQAGTATQSSPLSLTVRACMSFVFVGGLEALAFGLLPLPFLPGRKVWEWSPTAWIGMYALTVFLFVRLLLLPNRGFVSQIGTLAFLPVMATFVAFVLVSMLFMRLLQLMAAREPLNAEGQPLGRKWAVGPHWRAGEDRTAVDEPELRGQDLPEREGGSG
jgi:hypothetical protein